MTEIHKLRQEFDTRYVNREGLEKMKTIAAIIVILLTMPISYAMLDEAMKKIRVRNKIGS